MNPEHIITTNYDHLLEDVKHPNVNNYKVIKNDIDILEKYGKHYIIKMHGNIDDIANLVLKEDDYLKYSHTHEIIESYIKSLLFDKTFLFVGYSLNDNNLKLIMSYIINDIIQFDDTIKTFYDNQLIRYKNNKINGVYTIPDHFKETLDQLIILLLTQHISNLEDLGFLQQYTDDSDYLFFLFKPDSFDYSKITTADYMWCNIINDDRFRDRIVNHKSEFWTENDKKRIELGFGDAHENRVVYKYLID